MIRVILVLFLLISPANAKCKYYAYVDVENNKLVNKKEGHINALLKKLKT